MMNATPNLMPRPRRTAGFTLIELIIVIAIIGVLAAFAMPRLIEAQRDARVAKANAIYGSFRSAVALARSRCELDMAAARSGNPPPGRHCAGNPPAVIMDGFTVEIANRYPTAMASGIDQATQLNLEADGIAATNATTSGPPTRYFDINGGTAPNCRISYQEATSSEIGITAPTITVVTTGC